MRKRNVGRKNFFFKFSQSEILEGALTFLFLLVGSLISSIKFH